MPIIVTNQLQGCRTVVVVGDFYQFPPVLQRPVFADYFDEIFNIYHLWKIFKMCELTEVMRQKGDSRLIDLLNNIRVGKLTENDKELLKNRFVETDSELFPEDVVHIFSENEPARLHNIDYISYLEKLIKKVLHSLLLIKFQKKSHSIYMIEF